MPSKKPLEWQEQKALVAWIYAKGWKCAHVTNEGNIPVQYRVKLKGMGLSKGFPDLIVVVTKNTGFKILVFIEMKRQGATQCHVKPEQWEWIDLLGECGCKAIVCAGADDAIDELEKIATS